MVDTALRSLHRYLTYAFLIAFTVGGFGYALLIPPFQAPDEPVHWSSAVQRIDQLFRANSCSMTSSLAGHFDSAPLSGRPGLKQTTGRFANLPLMQPSCPASDIGYGSILSYPSAFVAKLLFPRSNELPSAALLCFYASRILSGLLMSLVLWRSLILLCSQGSTPLGLTLLAFCLSPLFIQQSFTVTADFVINAFAICALVACVAFYRLNWQDLALFVVTGLCAVTTKPTAAPLLLLPALAPLSRFLSRSAKPVAFTQLFPKPSAFVLVASAALLLLAAYTAVAAKNVFSAQGGGIDAAAQIRQILANPLFSLHVLAGGVVKMLKPDSMVGPLGWLDTSIDGGAERYWGRNVLFCFTLEVAYALFIGYSRLRSIAPATRIARQIAAAGFTLALATAIVSALALSYAFVMYLAWTPVGSSEVLGLQARYFFPTYLAAALLIPSVLAFDFYQTTPRQSQGTLSAVTGLKFAAAALLACSLIGYLLHIFYSLAIRFW